MQELKDQLTQNAGLTDEQAQKSIAIMKAFVLSKVPPMFSSAVEGFFTDSAGGTNDDGLI